MRRERVPPVSQELVKGTVIPVVLALLEDAPRYGYEMVQTVNARTNGALAWSEGTLYPALHKLEADGLVAAEWRAPDPRAGGHARRYYRLTGAGRRELKRRAAEWKTFTSAVGEFFGRVVARRAAVLTEPTSATAYSRMTTGPATLVPLPTFIQGLSVRGSNQCERHYLVIRGNAAQSQLGVAGRCGAEPAGEAPWLPVAVRLVVPMAVPASFGIPAGASACHGPGRGAALRLVLASLRHVTPPGANRGVR